jgi:sporadic carbohydrate cluster 2OG-Fe(II) oxygenase
MYDIKNGFFVKKSKNIEPLNIIKTEVFDLIKEIFHCKSENINDGLNNFHNLIKDVNDAEFNEKRVLLIQKLNKKINIGELLFKSFEDVILNLLGPDILIQKNCNVVIQRPNDPNPSELHRDAPGNSPYEIVLWIPLVDCYKTKAMYVVDYETTQKLYEDLEKSNDWKLFEKLSIEKSNEISVKFGEALFFSTAILHGSNINKEEETRFSLNIRFKNIFSPSGLKNQLQFFKKLTVSDLVTIGSSLELKKARFLNKNSMKN